MEPVVVETIPEKEHIDKRKSIINKMTPHIKEKLFEMHLGMISDQGEKSEDESKSELNVSNRYESTQIRL